MVEQKNLTLLTPAVLHCTALDSLKDKDRNFIKRYVIRFALLQGFWAVILYVLVCTTFVLPGVRSLRETGNKVLTNANFTKISIENGKASVDIKPAIWVYTVSDSAHRQDIVAIDSTGGMNSFYWDDRVQKGVVKRVDGVGIMPEYLFVKRGTFVKKFSFADFGKGASFTVTKEDIYKNFMDVTDNSRVLKLFLGILPFIFLFGVLAGGLLHLVYLVIVGAGLSQVKNKEQACSTYGVAAGLYVGWLYIFVLTSMAQYLLLITLGNVSWLFAIVKILSFVAVVFVGYLCVNASSAGINSGAFIKLKRGSTK